MTTDPGEKPLSDFPVSPCQMLKGFSAGPGLTQAPGRWQWLVARTWQRVRLPLPPFPPAPCPGGSQQGGGCQRPSPPGCRCPAASRGLFPQFPRPGSLPGSRERSSCPLLYLLHLTNLMTGGMRGISNMASLAGSGQSTQEPLLHSPTAAAPPPTGIPLLFARSG